MPLRKISEITDQRIKTRHHDLRNDPNIITTKYSSHTAALNSGTPYENGRTSFNIKRQDVSKKYCNLKNSGIGPNQGIGPNPIKYISLINNSLKDISKYFNKRH